MSEDRSKRICPVERAGSLESRFRKFLQNPRKILKPYISKGMNVLDLGCGPGIFSVEIARLLEGSGKVISADLQEGMLEKVSNKIKGTELEQIIEIHKCQEDTIGITEKVDFVLAFYVIHEIPDQVKLFAELRSILKSVGKIYIVEPKFHVSKDAFEKMIHLLESIGFVILERPKVFFSRTVLMKRKI